MFALNGQVDIEATQRAALIRDYERFRSALPASLEDYVREQYQIDLSSEYANHSIKNPFGKASGQLSLNHCRRLVGGAVDERVGH